MKSAFVGKKKALNLSKCTVKQQLKQKFLFSIFFSCWEYTENKTSAQIRPNV
jgi:hypothetical protein